jgi:hypothetical protein
MNRKITRVGQVCIIRYVELDMFAIVLNLHTPRDKTMLEQIEEVLQEWGCTWMWKALRIQGIEGWIMKVIRDGTLVAATDGLYTR